VNMSRKIWYSKVEYQYLNKKDACIFCILFLMRMTDLRFEVYNCSSTFYQSILCKRHNRSGSLRKKNSIAYVCKFTYLFEVRISTNFLHSFRMCICLFWLSFFSVIDSFEYTRMAIRSCKRKIKLRSTIILYFTSFS